MAEPSDIAESFRRAVFALVRNYVTVEGIINAVYTDSNTADVGIDGAVFMQVPFCILIDGATVGDLELPQVGSDCLMSFRDGSLQRPQIVKINLGTERKMNYPLFEFNGGENGGIPMTPPLVNILNLIVNAINGLVNLYNGHTHNVTAVGAPTGPPLVPDNTSLDQVQDSDIENPKITQ